MRRLSILSLVLASGIFASCASTAGTVAADVSPAPEPAPAEAATEEPVLEGDELVGLEPGYDGDEVCATPDPEDDGES